MARTSRQRKTELSDEIPSGFLVTIPDAKYATGQVYLLPVHIEKLKEWGFTSEEIHAIVAPRRTLARRKEAGQVLTATESDRVLRLQRIAEMADRVFGNHEKAQRWLRKQNRALDDVRPIDLLRSETGAHIVEQELHRIDYGMLA